MRSTYVPLTGHGDARVMLTQQEDRLVVLIDGRPIALAEKSLSK